MWQEHWTPKPCKTCAHPERAKIDAELLKGTRPALLLKAFGNWCTRTALDNHYRRHCMAGTAALEVVKKADPVVHTAIVQQARRSLTTFTTLFEQVAELQTRCDIEYEKAVLAQETRTALLAIREGRECLALLGKLRGEVSDASPLSDERWLRVRDAILRALIPYPEAMMAVRGALLAVKGAMDPAVGEGSAESAGRES